MNTSGKIHINSTMYTASVIWTNVYKIRNEKRERQKKKELLHMMHKQFFFQLDTHTQKTNLRWEPFSRTWLGSYDKINKKKIMKIPN